MVKEWCVPLALAFFVIEVSCTGGNGYGAGSMPLGASSPYGVLHVYPDTSDTADIPVVFTPYAGYHYSDTHINIFSHTHTFDTGLQDYSEIGIMPVQVDDDE